MEKKTMQRIIGILVVIALIIILLPLLFSKSETPSLQPATVKAPPFPDQQQSQEPKTHTSAQNREPPIASVPADTMTTTQPQSVSEIAHDTQMLNSPVIGVEQNANTAPQTIVATPTAGQSELQRVGPQGNVHPVEVQPTHNTVAVQESDAAASTESDDFGAKPAVPVVAKPIVKKSVVAKTPSAVNYEKYKKPAWVVQLGSFNSKENARKLTDKLRGAGYKAFVREVSASKNGNFRVYVGPEFQHASAIQLSVKLQQEMHLNNFIVKYNPLQL